MTRCVRTFVGLAVFLALGWGVLAAEPDLSEYRTVETAVTTKIVRVAGGPAGAGTAKRPAFLGVSVATDPKGQLAVTEVAGDSPAAKAGVQAGDLIRKFDGRDVTEDTFTELLKAKAPGDSVKLALVRQGKPMEATATLTPLSQPLPPETPRGGRGGGFGRGGMRPGSQRAVLGVQVESAKAGKGVVIEEIVPDSSAARAKLKVGEVILKVDNVPINSRDKLIEVLGERKPEQTVTLTLLLAEKEVDFKVQLGVESRGFGGGFGRNRYWNKPVYKLAIVCIEYPDVKHNSKVPTKAWDEALFSRGTYTKTSPTGQTVFGSLADYYHEQSYATLKVEGKVFEYVEASKKRMEYSTGDRTALLNEAVEKILKRDGKDALKDFDGLVFIYAGSRPRIARGSLYWPHRASFNSKGKSWPYFICEEGGDRMGNISVYCHEFGHMLGLPDLYARPEAPGMEGVGVWCSMANQLGNGRPQHFSAWSKEKLGWIQPTLIDPTVKQKLILAPIEDNPKQCFKVLARPDGSEYFLLENRKKKGFDSNLPAEGLLIWRVIGDRPILEESHGVAGPSGPDRFLDSVPFPSPANDAFTPYTMPSSRSQIPGGQTVSITNIRRLPDGKIAFHIGYEYQ